MPEQGSGWLVKATCEGFPGTAIHGLRSNKNERGRDEAPGYQELVVDLADRFDLIPASVMLFSLHQGTKLNVHLGSQGDLDVVLAEAMEWGSHVITVSVSGIPARRMLDAFGALAGVAATLSQLLYLVWVVTLPSKTFYQEIFMYAVLITTLLVNLGGYFYLLDDEKDKNHPFRLWARPTFRQMLMLALAPFTGDVLPLVACKACGLHAPLRAATRDGVTKWGVLMMGFQDGLILWFMAGMHLGAGAVSLSGTPTIALACTLGSVVINLPRRLSHFVLATCEAAFREKEELADDAKISMFASQKMAFRGPMAGSTSPPGYAASSPEMPDGRNGCSHRMSPPNGGSRKAGPPPPGAPLNRPSKPKSFREQLKSGSRAQKAMY